MPEMKVFTAKEQADQIRWERRIGRALKAWTTHLMKEKGITRAQARELILKKVEEKDGQVRRASILYMGLDDNMRDRLRATTFLPATPGTEPETVCGIPHIQTDKHSIRVGCIRITNEALFEMIRVARKQIISTEDSIVHQIGTYGSLE